MITFLTSSFLPRRDVEEDGNGALAEKNGFAEALRCVWPERARLLFFASDPDDKAGMEEQAEALSETLACVRLPVKELRVADHRDDTPTEDMLAWADVVFLAGGHAPTQLRYMRERRLREHLARYDGIVIGLSAGSVNAAEEVYLLPELAGETTDPQHVRFTAGLGLTPLQIIPHRDYMEGVVLDDRRFIEEIVLPDSAGRRFHLISDGSYFRIQDGVTTFFGEGEIIEDGTRRPLPAGVVVPTQSAVEPAGWKALMRADGYDLVFTVDVSTKKCSVHWLGERVADFFADCGLDYDDLREHLARSIVLEERGSMIEQTQLEAVLSELCERGSYVRTAHMDTDDGRRAKNLRISRLPGSDGKLFGSYFDISAELDHDWMTDEYARTGFLEQARHIIMTLPADEPCSLIYTNVRGFKAVNELFGDQSGDMVIFQTRDALRKHLKPLILGRLESDHFVLIVRDDLLARERLDALSRQIYQSGHKEYHFDIRCGIYRIRDRSVSVSHMIDRAKLAEKSIRGDHGASFADYDEMMRENYVKQQVLLSDMKDALQAGEFTPYYQPIVETKTGKIASAEALIRWQHHDLGLVPPGDFIPVIENAGRISALDDHMMNRVLDFAEKRAGEGAPMVPCAVNLSRIDFYDPLLMERIRTRVMKFQEAARYFRIEVTESAYADLEKNALDYLNEMKRLGIRILLDDFGSGMSSLSTLESFSFDIVKLDMGFIRRIGAGGKTEAIIDSTIRLAHALGAKVTAEGVETERQLSFLKEKGCDYIQGYYFYRPIPEEAFAAMLDKTEICPSGGKMLQ